jgi:DNA-binding NarL/FixJ family response regulator
MTAEAITTAETAAATTAACQEHRPDLLILDLELPDHGGFHVLEELEGARAPRAVLVLSDHTDGDLVLRALRLGARGYVTKAQGLQGLAVTIRRVLAGEHVIAPGLEQDAVLALGRLARRAREGEAVETHVAKLYRKLGVRTRVQAVSRAATLGLVEL